MAQPSQPFLIEPEPLEPGDGAGKADSAPNQGNGRPKGARNRRHRELEQYARSRSMKLLETIVTAAEKGDMIAAKIIMDRVWPKPRTAPITLDLPKTETPADVRAAMLDIIQRVADGEITTDDGASIVAMVKDILDAHSIKTLSPDSDNESLSGDPRKVFSDRLAKIIEARSTPADEPAV